MIKIISTPINATEVLQSVESVEAGASVLFMGSTRKFTRERETAALFYECYEAMALRKLESLHHEALRRWPIIACSIIHRIGEVGLGEASVAVAVSTAHRSASFEAAQWLIDTLKVQVPIWKREIWADGTEDWVHPSACLPTVTNSADTQGIACPSLNSHPAGVSQSGNSAPRFRTGDQ